MDAHIKHLFVDPTSFAVAYDGAGVNGKGFFFRSHLHHRSSRFILYK